MRSLSVSQQVRKLIGMQGNQGESSVTLQIKLRHRMIMLWQGTMT